MEKPHNILISDPLISKKKHTKASKQDVSRYYDHETQFNPVRGEMAMWRAVITQALMDAASNSRKSEVQYHKREAIKWLLNDSEDFALVCEHAGLDACYVRRMAKAALSRGCQWRALSVPKPSAVKFPPATPMEFKSLALPASLPPVNDLISVCA